MKNYKTSITGIITAVVGIATYYGLIPEAVGATIVTLGVALFSLFSKDHDVSGV
jgi:uncharacterized membrane protein